MAARRSFGFPLIAIVPATFGNTSNSVSGMFQPCVIACATIRRSLREWPASVNSSAVMLPPVLDLYPSRP